jgi:hypothetical protein
MLLLACFTLKIEAQRSFETSVNLIPDTKQGARKCESSATNLSGASKLFNEAISTLVAVKC